mmetsp:Transcript_50408/g.159563  ORF Transcript_50408/g.159563 Transcript_50408/m.159563 type:complete len:221 (-) Transcript_50408:322-984(-)
MSCSRLAWHLEQSPSNAGDPKNPHLPRHFFVDRGAAAGSAATGGTAGAVAEMASAGASDGWKGTACAGATSSSANCEGRSGGGGSLRSDGEAAAGDAGSRGDRCGDAGGACRMAAVAAVVAGGGGGRRGTGPASSNTFIRIFFFGGSASSAMASAMASLSPPPISPLASILPDSAPRRWSSPSRITTAPLPATRPLASPESASALPLAPASPAATKPPAV